MELVPILYIGKDPRENRLNTDILFEINNKIYIVLQCHTVTDYLWLNYVNLLRKLYLTGAYARVYLYQCPATKSLLYELLDRSHGSHVTIVPGHIWLHIISNQAPFFHSPWTAGQRKCCRSLHGNVVSIIEMKKQCVHIYLLGDEDALRLIGVAMPGSSTL